MAEVMERKWRSTAQMTAARRHRDALRMSHGKHVDEPNHNTLTQEGHERYRHIRETGKRTVHPTNH